MIRLSREDLFRADVAALERLAAALELPPPKGWRTERERKAKIVEAIERAEKRIGGSRGPRRRMDVDPRGRRGPG